MAKGKHRTQSQIIADLEAQIEAARAKEAAQQLSAYMGEKEGTFTFLSACVTKLGKAKSGKHLTAKDYNASVKPLNVILDRIQSEAQAAFDLAQAEESEASAE